MTEAAHQMTSNPAPPAERRPGSVGIGQGVEVRIYDESGKILQPNEHGEVCIRGKNVTNGYLNNQKANSSAFIEQDDGGDHFFRTGDRGFLDKGGYLTLVGRISEIINRGGEKISPIEVDSALLSSSPAIIEAVCFAVPDELLHQEVEAAVVLDKNHPESEGLDENRIQDLVREKISDFKVPKKIHFCEGSIPKGESFANIWDLQRRTEFRPRPGPTGKIQRKNLTAQFGKPSEGKNEPSPSAATNGKESPKKAVIACLAKALLLKEEDVKEDAALFALGEKLVSVLHCKHKDVQCWLNIGHGSSDCRRRFSELHPLPRKPQEVRLLHRDGRTFQQSDGVRNHEVCPFSRRRIVVRLNGRTSRPRRGTLLSDGSSISSGSTRPQVRDLQTDRYRPRGHRGRHALFAEPKVLPWPHSGCQEPACILALLRIHPGKGS